MKYFNIMALCLSVICFVACAEEKGDVPSVKDESPNVASVEVPNDELYRIAREVPSPIELAALIKENDMVFNAALLNDKDKHDAYNNKYNQAVNLGVYCADLGYINVYEKYAKAFNYILAVKDLSDDLKVGQFFDFTTMSRLAQNHEKIDSIMYISVESYDRMSAYLKDQGRHDVNALMVIGGWIEAMYITTQIQKQHPIPVIDERIGEQKVIIDDLCKMIGGIDNQVYFNFLKEELNLLKAEYDAVILEDVAPKRVKNDLGEILEVIDMNESKVVITQEQIAKIASRVEKIRTKIIE